MYRVGKEDYISKTNPYGKVDLTPYEAVKSMIIKNYKVECNGVAIDLCGKNELTKGAALEKTRELIKNDIHGNTLLNWENWGLIPAARIHGKYKLYPFDTPHEAHASWVMMDWLRVDRTQVRAARGMAVNAWRTNNIDILLAPFGFVEVDGKNPDPEYVPQHQDPEKLLAFIWLRYKLLSIAGLDLKDDSILIGIIKKARPSPDELYDHTIRIKTEAEIRRSVDRWLASHEAGEDKAE